MAGQFMWWSFLKALRLAFLNPAVRTTPFVSVAKHQGFGLYSAQSLQDLAKIAGLVGRMQMALQTLKRAVVETGRDSPA